MAEQIEEQEIEEPVQIVEQQHQQRQSDHIPLKDEFSSDLSEIDLAEFIEKHEEAQASQKIIQNRPKKKKIIKSFRWKNKWVKIDNCVIGSAPILLKKWVKVKYVPNEDELAGVNMEQIIEKDRGTLEMAQAIIQKQLNSQH